MPRVTVTRDSVCAADDVLAPHQKKIALPASEDPEVLLRSVLLTYWLPLIQGGKATWVCAVDGRPIGVVAQQWSAPKVFNRRVKIEEISAIHFAYHAQEEPELFLRSEK
jgi:hypothetical protein